jgi:hypothetical protein
MKDRSNTVKLTPEQARADLVARGLITPRNEEDVTTAKCSRCCAEFEHLKNRKSTLCGPCEFPSRSSNR